MPRIEINGLSIAYDLIGDGPKTMTITPGGRFSRETPGVRELAGVMAGHGYKVLIWDRPNTGESDICFDAECESFQNADALAGMIKALGLGKPLVYGASGGSREALLLAIRHPDCVSGVACQWLSGGGIGIATLPMSYNHDPALEASFGGMEAVAKMPAFAASIAANPRNKDLLMAWEPEAFIKRMRQWADWFFCAPGMPISCVRAGDLEGIKVPVLVLRSGTADFHHTRETSEAVAAMVPGADLQEPPWGDREWIERLQESFAGNPALFKSMPKLAPQLLEFAKKL